MKECLKNLRRQPVGWRWRLVRQCKDGRIGVRRWRQPVGGVLLTVCWLTTASVSLAAESDGTPQGDSSVRLAPNQSASIESAPVEQQAQQVVRAETSAIIPAGSSTILRRSGSADREAGGDRLSAGKSTPWYRTGIGAMVVVLGLVSALAWGAKRWMPTARRRDSSMLRVVGRTNLTPKHSVALVHLGRRFVMVGITGDRLTRLGQVTDPEEVAELTARTGLSDGPRDQQFDHDLEQEVKTYSPFDSGDNQTTQKAASGRGKRFSTLFSMRRDTSSLHGLLRRIRTAQGKQAFVSER